MEGVFPQAAERTGPDSQELDFNAEETTAFSAEIVGQADAVDRISLTVAVTAGTAEQTGVITGVFLERYASGSGAWAAAQVQQITLASEPAERRFRDCVVKVTGIPATDGLLATITVDHD